MPNITRYYSQKTVGQSLRGNPAKFLFWIGMLVLVLLLPAQSLKAQSDVQIDKNLENALLAEDWGKVVQVIGSEKNLSPVQRLLKAHACLALNRNNESLCLFLNTSSQEELKQWQTWAQVFTQKNPQQAIALYFLGDARARLKDWDGALISFSQALHVKPSIALVLNGRGIVYAAKEKWNQAIIDFDDAIKANPSFAEAYASRGTLNLQKKAGAEGALTRYTISLNYSPDFVLALMGSGCAHVALGHFEEAKKDFKKARNKNNCLKGIVDENVVKILSYLTGAETKKLANLSKEELGTELTKRFTNFINNPNQGTANDYHYALKVAGQIDPNLYNKSLTELKTYVEITPGVAQKITPLINNGLNTTAKGGWGEFAVSLIPKDSRAELSQKFGISYAGFGVEAGSGVGLALGGIGTQQHQALVTKQDFNIWGDMNKAVQTLYRGPMEQGFQQPGGAYGGVSSDLSAAHLDEGDWPFAAYYGLLYRGKK